MNGKVLFCNLGESLFVFLALVFTHVVSELNIFRCVNAQFHASTEVAGVIFRPCDNVGNAVTRKFRMLYRAARGGGGRHLNYAGHGFSLCCNMRRDVT